MFVVKYRKIFYSIAALLLLVSTYSFFTYKLKPSIEFTGGSLVSVVFDGEVPSIEKVKTGLSGIGYKDTSVRNTGTDGYIIRLKEISQEEKDNILNTISENGTYKPVLREFNTIGPILGKEAIVKSWVSILLVILAIVIFITFAFRKVSKPISSWVYGLVAIIALVHDVVIPIGVFSILGHLKGFEVDTLFVTALLVILGFSIHDTIVVFDRIRENLIKDSKDTFEHIVGKSISETLVRSVNTSLTTLLAIIILYIFGPETTRHFALAMGIGIVAGTYSSIFIGSPLLVTIEKWRARK